MPDEAASRSWVVTVVLEALVPVAVAIAASRALAHDMAVGAIEYLAVRPGYRPRLAARCSILAMAWLCAILPAAAAVDPGLAGTLILATAGGTAILSVLALGVAALSRSELAGAGAAGAWWLASLLAGRSLPDALPLSALHLAPFAFSAESWAEVKAAQLGASAVLLLLVAIGADWIVRRAIAGSS